jgi:ABC-2 type transport system permease protein
VMKLQRYIAAGGNLMICGEPGKQSILNPLLQPLGVQLNEGQVVQKSKDFDPELVLPNMTATAVSFYKPLERSQEDSLPVSMKGVAGLTYETSGPFAIKPLLVTDGRMSWSKKKRLDPDAAPEMSRPKLNAGRVTAASAGASASPAGASAASPAGASPAAPAGASPAAASAAAPAAGPTKAGRTRIPNIPKPINLTADSLFSAADGDRLGSVPTALSLTRHINGKEQRVIVTGDADFLSNAELNRNNVRTTNFTFCTGLFSWLSNGEFPIDTSRPKLKDNRFNLTDNGLKGLKILFLGVMPAILLILGIVLLIRRKRQ